MKELDVLLERFINRNQMLLEQGSWPELESLLEAEDDRLWDWIQDPSRPEARSWAELLKAIRNGGV
jgi:succinate dehydrogenase flavin-adding protein (antitoxin of CptAB toxin-antitoxin module)